MQKSQTNLIHQNQAIQSKWILMMMKMMILENSCAMIVQEIISTMLIFSIILIYFDDADLFNDPDLFLNPFPIFGRKFDALNIEGGPPQ